MYGDHISVLDAEVVANNTVDAGASIIEVIISEDDKNGVLALLSLDQDGVATEELEILHGLVGEGNDRVVIVDGIGDPGTLLALLDSFGKVQIVHQRVWLLLLLENGGCGLVNLRVLLVSLCHLDSPC